MEAAPQRRMNVGWCQMTFYSKHLDALISKKCTFSCFFFLYRESVEHLALKARRYIDSDYIPGELECSFSSSIEIGQWRLRIKFPFLELLSVSQPNLSHMLVLTV